MRLLVIVPRWMKGGEAKRALAQNRARFPLARRVILAEESLGTLAQDGEKLLCLPPPNVRRERRQWLCAIRDLRRHRFDKAIVLLGARGEVGYGEAKFWALIANARRRNFGDERLSWQREIQAKRHMASVLAARGLVAFLNTVAPRENAIHQSLAWRGARTFVYLRYAEHQHNLKPGHVFLKGENWDEAAACRCGWQNTENGTAHLILCDSESDFTAESSVNLASDDILVLCEVKNTQAPTGWQLLEQRQSFFGNNDDCDLWLRRDEGHPL